MLDSPSRTATVVTRLDALGRHQRYYARVFLESLATHRGRL
ncbi:MAG TPA: hypothetical protein VIJ07_05850 [Dermatophilaceae bacterium]